MNDVRIKMAIYVLCNLAYLIIGLYTMVSSLLYLSWFLIPKPVLFIIVLLELAGILNLSFSLNKAFSKRFRLGTEGQFLLAKWTLGISGVILFFVGSSPLWY